MSLDVKKLKCRIAQVPLSLVEQFGRRLLKCEKINNDRGTDMGLQVIMKAQLAFEQMS